MRHPPKPESFERFYYTKVGMGEGCGCAERIIDTQDIDRHFRARVTAPSRPARLRRFWRKLRGLDPQSD